MRPLAIVTTRLPPHMCGIGTYSWLSAKHWPVESTHVEFVVIDGVEASSALPNVGKITEFAGNAGRLASILDHLGDHDVFLHYAGRAYHRFGCPRWMPRVFSAWKSKFPKSRLMIFFHELPADMPFTSSHFLLQRINRGIVRKLAGLADFVVTNTEHHLKKLRELSGREDVHLIPVGSNIEGTVPELAQRCANEFIVFGLPFGRLQTLQWFASDIRRWHETGRLKTVHLIGPEDEKFTPQADALIQALPDPRVVVRQGVLQDADVAHLLGRARFALTNVTRETWSKSTGFMAAAASGCAVVRKLETAEPVPLSYSVAASEVDKISDSELEHRTTSLRYWYTQNADWPVTAERLAGLLRVGVHGE